MALSMEEKLREKGWSEEEIKQAMNIMYSKEKEKKRTLYKKSMNPVLYWAGLLMAIIGNLLIGVVLVPLMLVLSSTFLYVIIAILGIGFGSMFHLLLNDIEHIDQRHHVIAGVFLPAIALITIYVIVDVVNYLSRALNIPSLHSPIILSVIYVVSFTVPYGYTKLSEFTHKKRISKAAL